MNIVLFKLKIDFNWKIPNWEWESERPEHTHRGRRKDRWHDRLSWETKTQKGPSWQEQNKPEYEYKLGDTTRSKLKTKMYKT